MCQICYNVIAIEDCIEHEIFERQMRINHLRLRFFIREMARSNFRCFRD